MHQKEIEFRAFLKEMNLLQQTVSLLGWDSLTGMPAASTKQRAEVVSYMSGKLFEMSVSETMKDYIDYFTNNPDHLSPIGKDILKVVKREFDLSYKIPVERFSAYSRELALADEAWHAGRNAKSFKPFEQSLENIVGYLKEFIPLWKKDEKTNYDVLLNQYEPGMTVEKLDAVFAKLKDGLMAIRQTIAEKGTPTNNDFLFQKVSIASQRQLAIELAKRLGYDFNKGRLDDTTHPFMQAINRNDARITTRWNEFDFKMAMYGVIHEAGHGIYEQHFNPEFDYTPLSNASSMGIHESQSLFYEIILGSDKEFLRNNYALIQQYTEGILDDVDFETFYKGLHQSRASFIRIEADTLTYPLHIIIRYEIEKMIFNDNLPISDLPRVWNELYEQYLGITPKDDLEGILQDVHWSGGSFGYFPSYALGYMYAAQLRHSLEKDIDWKPALEKDVYTDIREWLTQNIHRHGSSMDPNQLLEQATGEQLNPTYLINLLEKLYFDVYDVK